MAAGRYGRDHHCRRADSDNLKPLRVRRDEEQFEIAFMTKSICIHGHFYQPPRENPWLESIELQDSAFPYHDWNERITYECYAPNARARLVDAEGRISEIVSNYSRMSFNFGPTVISWLKGVMPKIYDAIIQSDQDSRKRFSGHGSAIAQCYNHMIMPLANERDKKCQVTWGIADFESRFGRKPEGMWLPETAADDASLDALAEQGILFTILSPFQASQVRPLENGGDWTDVNGGHVDPSMPYLVKLPSGRSIAVFFYDAPVAQAIAFEKLLTSGEKLAQRLMSCFDEARGHDQLAHVATDGESYGHHFQHGDMALAYALHSIESNPDVHLTIYGEYLEKHPPTYEVQIHQPSAWSCPHGVGRWKENCGCNSGGFAGWNQGWRKPLREALDRLRESLAPLYESKAAELLKDPWDARLDYISVILDRTDENISRYFAKHGVRALNESEQNAALRLLEMQRHAMLMYTSCGWFFDELSGIETTQVIQYAARAIQIANELSGDNKIEEDFLAVLEHAQSNIPSNGNGRQIYERFVKPAVMTREKVAAHYAISSLFESYAEEAKIYSFVIHQEDRQLFTAGQARLAIGRIRVKFDITRSSDVLTYAVVHMGDHNVNCGVRHAQDSAAYPQLVAEMRAAFERADFPELIRLLDRNFGGSSYSLSTLFRDEQRKVLNQILTATREEIQTTYRHLTDRYAPLSRFLVAMQVPALGELAPAMEVVLNSELSKQFINGHVDVERVKTLLSESEANKVAIDKNRLSYSVKQHLDRLSLQWDAKREEVDLMQELLNSVTLVHQVSLEVNLWIPQNIYYAIETAVHPEMTQRNDDKSRLWLEKFEALGKELGFNPKLQPAAP